MKKEEYIKKWLEGSLTPEELRDFEVTEEYAFLTRLDSALEHFGPPEYDLEAEEQRLQTGAPSPPSRRWWVSAPFRVAAAVVLTVSALALFFLVNQGDEQVVTVAEKTELRLPDASEVLLNTHSTISFNEGTWDEKREVTLEGEAYFKVARGSRFDVVTAAGQVSVLGTVFNVKHRGEYFEVTCFEGSVKVGALGKDVVLEEQQSWRILNGVGEFVDGGQSSAPDWLLGESRFQSVPYHYVLQELKRQYQVEIALDNVDTTRIFSGSFPHNDVRLALKSITLPLNIQFELEKDLVRLSEER